MDMMTNWGNSKQSKLGTEVVSFEHSLGASDLFSDAALATLLDNHPSEYLDVRTLGQNNHPEYAGSLRTGDFRDCSGKDLLKAAKEGWIWINMRRAMNIHPEYNKVLTAMYDEWSEKTGRKVYNPHGGLLITAPIAKTPYHFDKTEVVLWHVRGKKRIYVYPLEDKYLSDDEHEKLVVYADVDDLPYSPEFDESATIVDLEEGQAITWPLNSPHRVENLTYCVSVTTEYSTRESAIKNASVLANATFRKKFGRSSYYSEQGQTERLLRSAIGRLIKKSPFNIQEFEPDMVSFKIDPAVPGYIVDIPAFERNF